MIEKDYIRELETEANERYNERYRRLGISPKTLGWGAVEHQIQRFTVIAEQCELKGKTIMDIGCGFADLYQFLKSSSIDVNYIGIDINPDFIDYCRKQFPEQQFYCKNIMLEEKFDMQADIVISLGTLNFKLKEDLNYQYSEMFIEKAFSIATEKLVVDFLSEHRYKEYPKEDFVFYHSPEKMLSFAMSLGDDAVLIHNYPPIPQKEFMIMLDRK